MTRNLFRMMVVSASLSIVAGVVGLYASIYCNVAPGAAIVVAGTLFFAIIFCLRTIASRRLWSKRGN